MAKLQQSATPDQVLANVNAWRRKHSKPPYEKYPPLPKGRPVSIAVAYQQHGRMK